MSGIGQGRLRQGFRDQLADAGETDPALAMIADGFITAHLTLCSAAHEMENDIKAIAKESPLAQRLMTIPSVCPIVSLSFIALVDGASRFRKAVDVGAFPGLTPRRYQSGEMDYSGWISKCGEVQMRSLLYEAAGCLIHQVKRFSSLKSRTVRLVARKGFKKAVVATARKLAVLMLTIWKVGTKIEWTK